MSRKTQQEMFPIIAEWEVSNESREDFCRRHDLALSTFSYWRTRYARSKVPADTPRFIKMEPQQEESLEIIYPNGVKLHLSAHSPLSQLQALIGLV